MSIYEKNEGGIHEGFLGGLAILGTLFFLLAVPGYLISGLQGSVPWYSYVLNISLACLSIFFGFKCLFLYDKIDKDISTRKVRSVIRNK